MISMLKNLWIAKFLHLNIKNSPSTFHRAIRKSLLQTASNPATMPWFALCVRCVMIFFHVPPTKAKKHAELLNLFCFQSPAAHFNWTKKRGNGFLAYAGHVPCFHRRHRPAKRLSERDFLCSYVFIIRHILPIFKWNMIWYILYMIGICICLSLVYF